VRKDRLDRVNRQLSELYGPLFALDRAGYRLWQVFRSRHGRDFWGSDAPPTPEMPDCLLDLCANVAGYEVVAERWRSGDFEPLDTESNISVIAYPSATLTPYLEEGYFRLTAEQGKLLRGLRLTLS
jgi:hypothetical protein